MAKSYLRQIIMEELQKVLKEEVRLGSEEYVVKKSPKPGEAEFVGPEQPTPIPGSGSTISSSPRRIATLKLQRKLANLGFINKSDVTGDFGPKTTAAMNSFLTATGNTLLTPDDVKKLSVYGINQMLSALSYGKTPELQKIALKHRSSEVDKVIGDVAGNTPLQTTSASSNPPKAPKIGGGPKGFGEREPGVTKDTGKQKEEEPVKKPNLGL